MLIDIPRIDDDDVAAATSLLSLPNSILPLFSIFTPGCKKKGTVSSMVTILDTISLAIAPLFARIATVTSGVNRRYHSRYAQEVIDLPDCLAAKTTLNRFSLKCSIKLS